MTLGTTTVNGIRHVITPALDRREVFVAEMPSSSDAQAVPNTGLGLVTAWLDPEGGGGVRLAWVRLADGRLVARPCGALRPAANIAARRILPRAEPLRRMA
jgi:hypothetical protein